MTLASTPATGPADWGARFQELTSEASQAYARLLRRYQELLERVARGELTPEQIQQAFRDYLQEQAAASTREMVEVGVGLLADLLHTETIYREAMLDGLLPEESPVPPPPAPADGDLMQWFQALSTYSTEQSARIMARHQQLIDRVAGGEIPAARVQEQGRRFLETHSPRFLGDVMNLGLTFVARLQHSSSSLADGLYDRLLGQDRHTAPLEPPVCVDLRGPVGSTAQSTLVIENTRSEPAEVVCRTSEFVARAFGRRMRPALEVAPERFTLAPGEHQDVVLRLPLDPALFAPDAEYAATLQVVGAGERELTVQLLARAESTAPASEPVTEPAPAATTVATAEAAAAASSATEPRHGEQPPAAAPSRSRRKRR